MKKYRGLIVYNMDDLDDPVWGEGENAVTLRQILDAEVPKARRENVTHTVVVVVCIIIALWVAVNVFAPIAEAIFR